MVTPIYNTMKRIDRRLTEAAIDGGADRGAHNRSVVTLVMDSFITVRRMGDRAYTAPSP
jgi:ABC-type spermidine/putrescine transport system permease subunit I